jgi:hypothetical protein
MVSRRTLLAALAAALLVLPLVAPAVARPPPEPLCGTCYAHSADDDVQFNGNDSGVTVELFANGSSRWTERVAVRRGADRLAANETLRRSLVERTLRRHVVDDERRTDVHTEVRNGALVTTYRVPDLGSWSLGVLTVDEFDDADRRTGVYTGAARAVVVGPEGFRLVQSPSGDVTATNATSAVWVGGDTTREFAPDVGGRLVFAEEGAVLAESRADAATALDEGPERLAGAAALALLPTLLLATVAVVYARSTAHPGGSTVRRLLAAGVVLAGVVGALLTLWLAFLLRLSPGDVHPVPPLLAGAVALLVVPAAALFALGYCVSRRSVGRSVVGALAALPWFGLAALVLNGQLLVRDPVTSVLVALGALAVTLLGVPGYLVGRRYAPASGSGAR